MLSTRSSDHCRWFDNLSFQHFLSGDDIKCNNMEREFVSTVQQASFEKGTLLRILEQVTRPTEFLWKLAESCCAGEHGAWRPVETDVERFWSHQSFIWGEGTALSIKWCNARVDAFFFKGRMCQHDIRIHTSHKRSWGFVHRCRLPKHTYLQRFSEPKGILLKFGLNCFSLKRCTVEFLRCPSRGSGESAA